MSSAGRLAFVVAAGCLGSSAWAAVPSAVAVPISLDAGAVDASPGPLLVAMPKPVASGIFASAYGAAAGVFGFASGTARALAGGTAELMWEVSYMLGTNRTPPIRALPSDRDAEFPSDPDELAATRAVLATAAPRAALPAESPRGVPASPPPAAVPSAEPGPSSPQATIDPGLLANFIFDRGVRRPDGSFFVPKTLQRLFELRTQRTTTQDVPVTLKLAGRIVPDPQAHGRVESSLLGRIVPPPTGLPLLGDVVAKGQVLGFVVPTVGVIDRSAVRRDVARLTTEIRVETESLEILRQFSFVPFRDGKIFQSERRIEGLRRERAVLLPTLQVQEALRAPSDGVISASTAIAGRIAQPGEMIFDIVNPRQLWIEALAVDPSQAEVAAHATAATAMTPEGERLDIAYAGSGLALQQQSIPVLFRIDNPPAGLRVGRPVTVSIVNPAAAQRGILVRREAITTGGDGLQEVWEQSEAEVFRPHPVRTRDLDGQTVLVVDGLADGIRVVVRGARLMSQLQ